MKKVILMVLFSCSSSSDAVLNEKVAEDTAENQLVNVITNPESGNVHFPAAFHRGLLNIAVSTGERVRNLQKFEMISQINMMRRMNHILIFIRS